MVQIAGDTIGMIDKKIASSFDRYKEEVYVMVRGALFLNRVLLVHF